MAGKAAVILGLGRWWQPNEGRRLPVQLGESVDGLRVDGKDDIPAHTVETWVYPDGHGGKYIAGSHGVGDADPS